MSATDQQMLFTPLGVGAVEVPNRVAFTAHGTLWNPWSEIGNARYTEYQRRRAANGVGMIIAEGIWVEGTNKRAAKRPKELEPMAGPLANFNAVIDAESPDVVTVIQLVAAGASDSSEFYPRGRALVSFNGMQSSTNGEPSHRMSAAEIEEMVNGHAQLARFVVEQGMDGVELLAGYGYLLHQSLSPWGNGRDDEWGEPLAFSRACIEAIREAIGPDKIIGYRMPVDDDRAPFEGGSRHDELMGLAKDLVDTASIDYFNVCMGSRVYEYTNRTARSYRHKPGVDLPLAANLRRVIEGAVPVIGANRILTPEQGEEALQRGDCDIVALTRAHMADSDVVAKFRAGQSHRIRRCVGANDCGSVTMLGLGLTCFHNPEVGHETELVLTPAADPKRVTVVGAGPAGLKAAEIAARRGHHVTVVEALDEPGGQLRHVRATTARELYGAVSWLVGELEAADADLRLGTRLDPAGLRELAPEVVVLATGAHRQTAPTIPGADDGRVVTAIDVLAGADVGGPVLVADRVGDMEASLVAEVLIKRGLAVTYATPLDGFAPRAGYMNHLDLLPIFEEAGCEILTKVEIERIDGRSVLLVDRRGVRRECTADTIVAALVPQPENGLLAAVEEMSIPYHLIGDALAPRHARAAINDGDAIARTI